MIEATCRKTYFSYSASNPSKPGLKQFWLAGLLAFITTLTVGAGPAAAEPYLMGALGDSISSGFNTYRFGDNRDYTWATANTPKVNSHYKRLKEIFGQVAAYNEAVVGSVSSRLQTQTRRLLRRGQPHYVTVSIGANDVCRWGNEYEESIQAYRTNIRTMIATLIESRKDVNIVLMPIPNLYHLWELGSQRAQCQRLWDTFNICPSLLNSRATPEDREALQERRNAANEQLEQIAGEFPDNVTYPKASADTVFEWQHVSSLDCFHPSVEGQDLIAETTWQPPTNSPK